MSDEWMTPPDVLAVVRKALGGQIDLDPASNAVAQKEVKAVNYYSLENNQNGLVLPWRMPDVETVFCNPPYSASNIDAFANKAVKEFSAGAEIVMLVNSSTDAQWYHQLLNASAAVLLWRGRIKFWKIYNNQAHAVWDVGSAGGKARNSPRYLNTVFYLGRNVERFASAFQDRGTLLKRI